MKEKTGVDNVCERVSTMKRQTENEGTFICGSAGRKCYDDRNCKIRLKLERETAKEYRIDEQ